MNKMYIVINNEYGEREIECVLKDKALAEKYTEMFDEAWVEEFELDDDNVRSRIKKNNDFYIFKARMSEDYKPTSNGDQSVGYRYSNLNTEKRNTHSKEKTSKGYFAHYEKINSGNNNYRLLIDLEILLSDNEEERLVQENDWHIKTVYLFERALELFFVEKKTQVEIDNWIKTQI